MILAVMLSVRERDHPREYGENAAVATPPSRIAGSSPRIRGKSWDGWNSIEPTRIIPANTGKMSHCSAVSTASGDHPREYGENGGDFLVSGPQCGSSPRIRGKLHNEAFNPVNSGIIPANTGKIGCDCIQVPIADGSSPRIRGK